MRLVTLVTGQSCTVRCEGKLRVKLFTGDLEVAGTPLEPNRVVTLDLSEAKALVVYTLEGCVFGLQPECLGDSNLTTEVRTFSSGMASLVRLVRKGFDAPAAAVNAAGLSDMASSGALRIAVAGPPSSGKYLTACTVVNSLNRSHSKGDGAVFCDLTTAIDGQLSRLGCLGCIETHREVPLWEGMHWSTYSTSIMFYHGLASSMVDSSHFAQFLLAAESACESALWMSSQKKDAPIVCVLPSFDATVSKEMFYRAVLEPFKPTHVIFVGDEEDGGGQQAIGRLFPTARLIQCGAVVSGNPSTADLAPSAANHQQRDAAVIDYFQGTDVNPLGSTIATFPLSSINFVSLVSQSGGAVEAKVVDTSELPTRKEFFDSLKGAICAVSLGATVEEVPYANVAGLVVISNIFHETNEVEVVSPSSDSFVPSSFFIIPTVSAFKSAPIARLFQ